ncbi:hypothetical protein B0A55_10594 [Friedmanniomyces simplex]|uniref:Uncharacterized protein n=1 Tax=Friedmanniomyces simplex TaxID=329884 RepID=A0A4U0WFW2_9PEZI|nr:hypothetical protein B0A55_10594 [Friedmanniomyces simplex]
MARLAYLLACLFHILLPTHGLPTHQAPLLAEDTQNFAKADILLPIDHFNSADTRVYSNKYWIYADSYQRGGPVFLYDGGERGVSDHGTHLSFSPLHPLLALAKRLGGLALVWEHRFYGESLPFPDLTADASPDENEGAYRYLNTEQALEDAVFLATHFQPPGLEHFWDDLKPERAPWVWIGGSYPGQRAAMIRKRNPDVFRAAWSSSAPVETAVDFPEYYLHISRDLPSGCRRVIQRVVRYVDEVLLEGSAVQKSQLRWEIARRWPSDRSLLSKIAFTLWGLDFHVASHLTSVIAWDWQTAGMTGPMNRTCTALRKVDTLNQPRGTDTAALSAVLDAIESSTEDFAGKPRFSPADQQAWQYQVCTEYPFFRTSLPSSDYNVLSSILTPESIWANTCARQYPWLSYPPDISASRKYANWDSNLTNIMWTAGLQDPWQERSMLPKYSLVPDAPSNRTPTREVPGADQVPKDGRVFGLLFAEGRHCGDLSAGGDDAEEATDLFERALGVWFRD